MFPAHTFGTLRQTKYRILKKKEKKKLYRYSLKTNTEYL